MTSSEPAFSAIATAATVDELIETIPAPYRPVLGPYIVKKYRIARSRTVTARTLSSYQRHMKRGTYPAAIRRSLMVPFLDVTNEFLASPQYASTSAVLHHGVIAARKAALENAISQKMAELAFLSSLPDLDVNTWKPTWARLVTNAAAELAHTYKGYLVQDVGGRHQLIGMPPAANNEFSAVLSCCVAYAARVLQLARTVTSGGSVVIPMVRLSGQQICDTSLKCRKGRKGYRQCKP
ncbi:hypothetical protein VFPPC_11368 [Pochonia chlamydosporia 170]|uniref:Uncharacterized protein n=1 Tax=Pochonia chlamydosporia 170 TaxID=1380566 RepID=A0A179F0X9_METCM|nr:hypothetical protein VFPPC_11368 [Pochonia chlamydosporia 170]OAQ58900.1 hypothetical protein VFPPC_11368 [Pochonia chlamydosporia 170]